jgi:hypothetical protein
MNKSYIFIIICLIFLVIPIHGQSWEQNLPSKPSESLTLFDYQKAFNDYWAPFNVVNGYYMKNGAKVKAGGWKLFKRWEYYWLQRVNPVTGEFPNTNAFIEFNRTQFGSNKPFNVSSSASWTALGPGSSGSGYSGQGRINCIAFHPSDLNTYWVGSPSGGIWRTTNNGSNWTILNDNMPVLGVSDIAVNPDYASSNTMYIATGDRDGGSMWSLGGGQRSDNVSAGVFKTTDGGANWFATGLTFVNSAGNNIGRLIMDPSNSSILFASTREGIYKTINAGSSWTLVYSSAKFINDMKFKPGNSQIIYACNSGGTPVIIKSINGGTNWSPIYTYTSSESRCELGVTAANPEMIYALVCTSSRTLNGIYQSTNSGASFTKVYDGTVTNQNLLGYNPDGSDMTGGQGTYDLCIAVSPVDANLLYVGGINLFRSTNGGVSWKGTTNWYDNGVNQAVHADQHMLAFQNSTTLFAGNDGGLYRSTLSGGVWGLWVDKTPGLFITQIYRIGASQQNSTKVLIGNQDNGSKLYSSGSWKDVNGGDGMECIVDYSNSNYMYTSIYYGQIERSSDGYASGSVTAITGNIPGGQPTGFWVTPFIQDPVVPATLYFGFDRIWKTTSRGDAGSWTDLSGALSASNKLRSIGMSPSNTAIIYTADQTHVWKTINANTATPPAAWTNVTGTLPVTSGYITYLAVKDNDPNTVWVTIGGYSAGKKVYQTIDGGTTWTSISGTLPNIPIMCIAQNKRAADRNQLYIGTDAGVYVKDGTNDWSLYSNGLPNCVISDLAFYYDAVSPANDKLRAGTFARGLWETPVDNSLTLSLTALIQGFYNGSVMTPDTVTVELHNTISPYALIESKKGVLNSSGTGTFKFTTAANGTPYYLVIKHRNSIETWSSAGNSFSSSALTYSFTTSAAQAYANNMILKSGNWCIFGGDVTQDGLIDSGDLGIVDNDNANYVSGYKTTDVNGDGLVDSGDLGIVDNNNANYIGKIIPSDAPVAKKAFAK